MSAFIIMVRTTCFKTALNLLMSQVQENHCRVNQKFSTVIFNVHRFRIILSEIEFLAQSVAEFTITSCLLSIWCRLKNYKLWLRISRNYGIIHLNKCVRFHVHPKSLKIRTKQVLSCFFNRLINFVQWKSIYAWKYSGTRIPM